MEKIEVTVIWKICVAVVAIAFFIGACRLIRKVVKGKNNINMVEGKICII